LDENKLFEIPTSINEEEKEDKNLEVFIKEKIPHIEHIVMSKYSKDNKNLLSKLRCLYLVRLYFTCKLASYNHTSLKQISNINVSFSDIISGYLDIYMIQIEINRLHSSKTELSAAVMSYEDKEIINLEQLKNNIELIKNAITNEQDNHTMARKEKNDAEQIQSTENIKHAQELVNKLELHALDLIDK